MVLLEEFEKKFEYFLFETREHRVLDNENHLGVIVNNGDFIAVNHLTDIVVEEIKMFRDSNYLAFQSRPLGFCKSFARYDTSLNLF